MMATEKLQDQPRRGCKSDPRIESTNISRGENEPQMDMGKMQNEPQVDMEKMQYEPRMDTDKFQEGG